MIMIITHDIHHAAIGEVHVDSTSPAVTPNDGSYCLGEDIVFTCQVTGTQRLVWISYEYIGRGGDELAFSTAHRRGKMTANRRVNGTYAVLVSTDGVGKINSDLHLIAQFSGTVTCVADPPGLMTNVTISINGKYIINIIGSLMLSGTIQTPETSDCQLGGMASTGSKKDSTATTGAVNSSSELQTAGNNSKS